MLSQVYRSVRLTGAGRTVNPRNSGRTTLQSLNQANTGLSHSALLKVELRERRDLTTRGTPRIRKRYFWRKQDAEAAKRLGVEVFAEDEDPEEDWLWTDEQVAIAPEAWEGPEP